MRKTLNDPVFSRLERRELNLGGESRHIDGGLNTADLPYSLDTTQSPDMCNMWFYDGALRKRWGQQEADSLESGAGIDGACVMLDGKVLFQSGGKIYKWDPCNEQCSEVYTLAVPQGAAAAPKGSFIRYGAAVYFINGCEFKIYQNDAMGNISPYVPTLYTDCDPETGSGDFKEYANILSNKYCVSFTVPVIQSASGVTVNVFNFAKELTISSALVSARVNGVEYTENSGFTVDRTAKSATFTSGIAQGSTVEFYAEATDIENAGLKKCRFGIVYGGESRLVLGGNGTNVVYCSEIYDPSYFPQNEYFEVGDGDEITGFGRQYNILAVFKPHEIASLTTSYSASKPHLTPSTLNPFIGCDIPGSIANIGNRITYMYDERSGDTAVEDGQSISLSSFNWEFWSWSSHTWAVPGFFKTYTRRPRRRRVIFFSVMLENDKAGTDLSIADISIEYHFEYKIK